MLPKGMALLLARAPILLLLSTFANASVQLLLLIGLCRTKAHGMAVALLLLQTVSGSL